MAKNTMILYGRNSVFERLKADPKSISKILVREDLDIPHIEKLIHKNNIPAERLTAEGLNRMKPAGDLQGIIAKVDKFKYACFDDFLEQGKDERLTLIFLDRIYDPHNLGAIIRSAACFGRFAVVIPEFKACEVTEAVLHVASGGENYTPVSKVKNLSNAIIAAKKQGYWIMGGVLSDNTKYINEISLPFPLALVLGSEGEGVRYGVEKQLDIKARIPMQGARLSFNVAMAAAIFCHEISKQRGAAK